MKDQSKLNRVQEAEHMLFETLRKYLPYQDIGYRFCLKDLFVGCLKYKEQGQGCQGWMGVILLQLQHELGLVCVGKNNDDVNVYEVVRKVNAELYLT